MTNKVSVIVPAYNIDKYIKKCLNSITNQTYNNIEIIIVNDGSTDKTLDVCKEMKLKDSRIKIFTKENGGVSSARNYGLKQATGDYIMFVDSDDWIDSTMIEDSVKYFSDNVDIVKSGYIREYTNRSISYPVCEEDKKLENNEVYRLFIEGYKLNSPCCELIRKSCIDGHFNEKLVMGEDLLFNLDLYTKAREVVVLNKCYYHYSFNDGSATNTVSLDKILKRCDDTLFVYNSLYKFIDIWNKSDYEKNVTLRIITELNRQMLQIFLTDLDKKKQSEIIDNYFNNEILKNKINKLSIIDIVKYDKKYIPFNICMRYKRKKLYCFFGKMIYKKIKN